MKTFRFVFAALVALLGSTGCVTSQGPHKSQLPPDWIAALPKAGSPVAAVAGVYVELGDELGSEFTRNGTIGTTILSRYLSQLNLTGKAMPWLPQDRSATTELRRADDTHLELIRRVDDDVTGRAILTVEFEKDTGTMLLRQKGESRADIVVVAHSTKALRLWRAPDGRLYVQQTERGIGAMMLQPYALPLLPRLHSNERWSRWDPATPEGLQRQAAFFVNREAAAERRREMDRLRVTVGAKATPPYGADVLTGRRVKNADYAGKVVVMHWWSAWTGAHTFIVPARAAYDKFRSGGVEFVGICINPANERRKVTEFIQSNGLAWTQLHDGQGLDGGLYDAYFGAPQGSYCIIDRHGNVAAFASTAEQLEAAVTAALAGP